MPSDWTIIHLLFLHGWIRMKASTLSEQFDCNVFLHVHVPICWKRSLTLKMWGSVQCTRVIMGNEKRFYNPHWERKLLVIRQYIFCNWEIFTQSDVHMLSYLKGVNYINISFGGYNCLNFAIVCIVILKTILLESFGLIFKCLNETPEWDSSFVWQIQVLHSFSHFEQ